MELQNFSKGSFVVNPCQKVQGLIEQLQQLAVLSFPNQQVFTTLQQAHLSQADLEPYIFYADYRYTRNRVYKCPDFELILMCWQAGQQSCVHGHEGQKCWMSVITGTLEFANYQDMPEASGRMTLTKISTQLGEAGFIDGPAYIHGVRNASNERAISLHLYAQPFSQCDAYDLTAHEIKKVQLCYHSIEGKLVSQT
jgi:cysteine dioxygenase